MPGKQMHFVVYSLGIRFVKRTYFNSSVALTSTKNLQISNLNAEAY